MTEAPEAIRSYQRIFRPERRIYSIEGRPLPVPGGVPLRWLAYASGTLVSAIALSTRSPGIATVVAAAAGLAALGTGGRRAAIGAALGGFVAVEVGGWIVAALDWPLRLIVVPVAIATLATQATPDGRTAERFALSWLLLRLTPARRSLGREVPAPDRFPRHSELWVAPDERSPDLRRGTVRGPARVAFPVAVEQRRRRRRRIVVRRLGWHRRRGSVARAVELDAGEVLEVRP